MTTGSPQRANTLKRCGSTSTRSTQPPKRDARMESCLNRNSPTCSSFSVMDSISISARVISNKFMGSLGRGAILEGENTAGRTCGETQSTSDSAPSVFETNDSGPVLARPPNRRGREPPRRFRRIAPFSRASEAYRNRAPGYWWPPRLYQKIQDIGFSRAASTAR